MVLWWFYYLRVFKKWVPCLLCHARVYPHLYYVSFGSLSRKSYFLHLLICHFLPISSPEFLEMSNLQLFISVITCCVLRHWCIVRTFHVAIFLLLLRWRFRLSGFGRPFDVGPGPTISTLLQMDPSPRCEKCRFCWFIKVSVVSNFFMG